MNFEYTIHMKKPAGILTDGADFLFALEIEWDI